MYFILDLESIQQTLKLKNEPTGVFWVFSLRTVAPLFERIIPK